MTGNCRPWCEEVVAFAGAVRFAPRARDNRMRDVQESTSSKTPVFTRRTPSAAKKGTRSISGDQAAAIEYVAVDSGELGLRDQ
jgi:hypothetical protein